MNKSIVIAVAGVLLVTSGIASARSGKEIYDSKCFVCHVSGVANAPKFGDKAAWAPRIATGMDAMLANVKNGKAAMPPKGTCMDCTDDEFKAAISYMVDAAK